MPGILGIVQPEMNPAVETHLLQKMIQPLAHYPWYRCATEHVMGATLGLVSLGMLTRTPCCLRSEDGRYLLAFEGELYNTDELLQALGMAHVKGDPPENQTAVVLQAMRRWGTDALNRFNGLFQLALWDARKQELVVSCDPGGLRPIYIAHKKGKLAFAPEVKALLALPWVSREVNHRGILSFLRHGFPLGNHTFFQDVKVLPGGSFAVFRHGQLRIRRYWKMRFQEKSQFRQREMQHRFLKTWMEVMENQSRGEFRLGVPLSGGVDSRMILAALAAQGKKFLSFTLGNPGCQDARIAQQIAGAARCPNLFSPVVPSEVSTGMERAVYVTDGMYNCFHANVRHLLPNLSEKVDLVFDGVTALDSLYDPEDIHLQRLLRQADPVRWLRAEVACDDIRAFPLGHQAHVDLIAENAKRLFDDLQAHDFLHQFAASKRPHVKEITSLLDLFWLEEFQHRFSAFGPQLLRTTVEVRCPFFDKKILELIGETAPIHRSSDKPLQRHAIHKMARALAGIPWERTGLPLTAGYLRTFVRRGARFVQKKAGVFIERQLGKAPNQSRADKMIDYDEMIRTSPALLHLIVTTLIDRWDEGSRIFSREGLQALLNYHLGRAGNHAEIIGRILTVEMWHKLFVRDLVSLRHYADSQAHEIVLHKAA